MYMYMYCICAHAHVHVYSDLNCGSVYTCTYISAGNIQCIYLYT